MDIKQQLSELNKMSKRSVLLYHKFASAIGISDSSLGILYTLSESAPCTQYDLYNKWSIPKQTVNTTIALLQSKRLVVLSQTGGIRNKKDITLTAEGKAFIEKTIEVLRNAELAALAELTPEEAELYIGLNTKYNACLVEKLQKIMAETS